MRMRQLISLALSLAILSGAGAAFAQGSVILLRGENGFPSYGAMAGVAVSGDVLYVCEGMEGTLYAYRIGDEQPTTYLYGSGLETLALAVDDAGVVYRISATFSEDGLDLEDVSLYRMDAPENGTMRETQIVSLAWTDLIFYEDNLAYSAGVEDCLVHDGSLYLVADLTEGKRLFRFDLATGICEDMGIDNPRELERYDGDVFLLRHYNPENKMTSISYYDTAEGTLREIVTMGLNADNEPPHGICYDRARDWILFTYDGWIRAIDLTNGGADFQVATLPLPSGSYDAVLLGEKYLPYNGVSLVSVDTTNPSGEARTLRVYTDESPSENATIHFLTESENVRIISEDKIIEANDLISAMLTKNQDIDIIGINTNLNDLMVRLVDKGFAAEIDSQRCREFVAGLQPVLKDAVSRDDRVYILPTSFIVHECFGVDRQVFREAGFNDEDIPETWPEFIDFIAGWSERGIDEDKYMLFSPNDMMSVGLPTIIVSRLLTDYELYMTANLGISYDSGLLKELLEKVKGIDFDAMSPLYLRVDYYNYDGNAKALFDSSYMASSRVGDNLDFSPLPLPLQEGFPAFVKVGTTGFAISAYSQNKELATAYLECLMDSIDPVAVSNMSMDYPDLRIRADTYEARKFAYENALENAKALYESADEDMKEQRKAELDDAQALLDALEAEYLTTEESVAEYKGVIAYPVFMPGVIGDDSEAGINRFLEYRDRMLKGEISVDEFISFLTQTRLMQQLEDQ